MKKFLRIIPKKKRFEVKSQLPYESTKLNLHKCDHNLNKFTSIPTKLFGRVIKCVNIVNYHHK